MGIPSTMRISPSLIDDSRYAHVEVQDFIAEQGDPLCVAGASIAGVAVPSTCSGPGNPGLWCCNDTFAGGGTAAALTNTTSSGELYVRLPLAAAIGAFHYYWGDQLLIPVIGLPIIQFRISAAALTTAGADIETISFGIQNQLNYRGANAGAGNAALRVAMFRYQGTGGAGSNIICRTDDGTTDSGAVNSAVAWKAASAWREFKIDCTDIADVRFFYRDTLTAENWTRLAATTTFTLAGDLTAKFQPFFVIEKTAIANAPSMTVDYIKASWQRQ